MKDIIAGFAGVRRAVVPYAEWFLWFLIEPVAAVRAALKAVGHG